MNPMTDGRHEHTRHEHHAHASTVGDASAAPAIDPVCGMRVDPARSAGSAAHAGTTYYFCGKGCLAKFTADPARYATQRGTHAPVAAPKAAQYSCPMHPEVVQDGP